MNTREYMARRCVCKLTRAEHAHFYQMVEGRAVLRVLPVPNPASCAGFLDEFELELGGHPLENEHLAPLAEEELAHVRIRQTGLS